MTKPDATLEAYYAHIDGFRWQLIYYTVSEEFVYEDAIRMAQLCEEQYFGDVSPVMIRDRLMFDYKDAQPQAEAMLVYAAVRIGAPVVGVWRLEGYYEIIFVCETETRFVAGDKLPDVAAIAKEA